MDDEDGKDLDDSILRPACTVVLKPEPACKLLVVALVKRERCDETNSEIFSLVCCLQD